MRKISKQLMGLSLVEWRQARASRTIFLTVAAVLLLILILLGDGLGRSAGFEPNIVVGAMPGKTEEAIRAELNQRVSEMTFAINYNYNPSFEDGTASGKILFENSSFNVGKLLRLEIYLEENDSETLIYQTGLLRPGSYVNEASLDVDLEAGSYACVAHIYAYRESDESYIGKVLGDMRVTVLH